MRNEVKFSIVALDLFERPVRLRLPFRFGVVTLILMNPGEVVEDIGDIGMVWADLLLAERQRLSGRPAPGFISTTRSCKNL